MYNLVGVQPCTRPTQCSRRQHGKLNILLLGSGDPRHIFKTIAGLKDTDTLHVWVVEHSMEIVARQLLLLSLALSPQHSMGLQEKTEVFLEVFGNSEIRSQSECILKQTASQLSLTVTDTLNTSTNPCLDTTMLRFKDRDELDRIFKQWIHPPSSQSMSKLWDSRVRHHLGTRYDSKLGCFDWDLSMKLHQKGCGAINKQQYVRWRETGVAFEMREGLYQTTNHSLLSTRIFNNRGDRLGIRGYWGDIVSSPYLSFGIETDNKALLQTQNGQHTKTAQDISCHNVQELFQALVCRSGIPSFQQGSQEGQEQDPSANHRPSSPQPEANQRFTDNGLLCLDGVNVTFLPVDSLSKLPKKQRFSHLFNTVYCSASLVHQLGPSLRQVTAPDAVLVVELAEYLLDLSKEQIKGFAEKVDDIAREAGFESANAGKSDVYSTYTLQKE
ncbi:dynein axonemal assembly factor 3-like isoform X2 [Conger conger]|uniref:dynein axonemal assembly factor 3-like isoform X2 n=1 Tax=Conger conger TaxID=82655 RepID=UPI002A5AA5EB|nr:dynein axonemal assembly factor 3-like isoform X2 [Conger conger]XP_061088795.1 dynein axonemal assembly factor 3-like isoform X2 [Conger conger]